MLILPLLAACFIAQSAPPRIAAAAAPMESPSPAIPEIKGRTKPNTPSAPIAIFTPPRGWQCARPKKNSPHIQVGFVGKGNSQFHPSINLATEEIDISLKDYVKAVKEIHMEEKGTTWRDLGKFSMKGGNGRLTEIVSPSALGDVKILQAILVQGKTAYILTAAVLKKECPEMQKEILQSLHSLALQPDLFSPIPDIAKRKELEDTFAELGHFLPGEDLPIAQKKQWEDLQEKITEKCPEMGSHWQFLAMSEGHRKIYPFGESR